MKRFLLLAVLAVVVVTSALADRTGTMYIKGAACEYDTLVHRRVGPGVTYTQFQFDYVYIGGYIPYKMRTHLITIDMTNPYNRLSPYLSDDEYNMSGTQEQSVIHENFEGRNAIASVNGFLFVQTPPESYEPYTYMESLYHLVNDGLVRYENNTTSVRYYSDASKKGYVGNLTMKAKVTSSKGASAEIGQINHHRDFVRNKKQLALFCNKMNKAKDTKPNDGVEVILKGGEIRVGTNQLTVVQKKAGCGTYLQGGQHAITGVGAEMEAFLNGLQDGETVTIEIGYVDGAGNAIAPLNTYSSFIPNCVVNGVAAGYQNDNYAISATGVSKDGNTVYLADLEISDYSNAPTGCLEDFLIAVGAWNACYHDGGPSAEMTINGDFVTNNSIGGGFNGRSIPNGVMVYSTAPYDQNLVSVACDDRKTVELGIGETFTPLLYGYNQYGEMIDKNAAKNEDVVISCTDGLGEISENGTFTARNPGSGVISIGVKGYGTQITIPVNITIQTGLFLSPSLVFTGENRPVQVSVKYMYGDKITDVDPSLVSWSVDDKYVVSDCENGLVVPYLDGYATLSATYEGITTKVDVEVENLEEEGTETIDLTDKVRSMKKINLYMPSVPHGIYIETEPASERSIVVTYSTGEQEHELELKNAGVGVVSGDTITFDYDAPDTYPIKVKSISPSTTVLKKLMAIYKELPTGISNLYADETTCFAFSRVGESLTLINCSTAADVIATVYSFDGTKLAETKTYLSESGSCTLDVKRKDPIIVRVQTKNGVQVFKLAGE